MTTGVDFLGTVVAGKRMRLLSARLESPLALVRDKAHETRAVAPSRALHRVLSNRQHVNIIAEIKRASPSKGHLGLNISVEEVAEVYERGGAAAISILTEQDFFHGSLNDLGIVRRSVSVPVLRKDFIFDEYQVYESAAAGADALLLIAELLNDEELSRLLRLTERELGMDALVEVHTPEEMLRAAKAGATLIGVNNRNLHTFEVSLKVSHELIAVALPGAVLVSESGLKSGSDIKKLRGLGYSGFLVGEALIRAGDREGALRSMIQEAEE